MNWLRKNEDKILLALGLVLVTAIIVGAALLSALKRPKSPIILKEPKSFQSQLGPEFFEKMGKLFRGFTP